MYIKLLRMTAGYSYLPVYSGLKTGLLGLLIFAVTGASAQAVLRQRISFNEGWKFFKGEAPGANARHFQDANWRSLNLPHDWSIEGPFNEKNPAGVSGGALPGGMGWYRKSFEIPAADRDKNVFVDFDGIYCNSEVWINGHYLGKRPNGYISFRYNLTPYLEFGSKNEIAVKVDNSHQPNSRWYSGSGIYRNVWLVTTDKIFVDHWGTYITTPRITGRAADAELELVLRAPVGFDKPVTISTSVLDASGREIANERFTMHQMKDTLTKVSQQFHIPDPELWSVARPYIYQAVTRIIADGRVRDEYRTPFGIRYFSFDINNGFSLNGKRIKINGVCDHHDLGCLGAAINTAALRRQLKILKSMGCNAIRTSHNPPAPELLDLCDRMGILVMDEAFDMWKQQKTKYDYHLVWDAWHKKDLEDQVLRDRNHPSVIIWSIGNEIPEQWNEKDSSGMIIARELVSIVKSLDTTRPVTSALDNPYPKNPLIRSGALDLIGYNYHQQDYPGFHERFPGKKFIATETVSAFESRGYYAMPSDSIRRWSEKPNAVLADGTVSNMMSAYDNACAAWGSTHEETLKIIDKYPFLSGQFIWTGFDYIGEPTPYGWPSRSSYFGVIDLAGFPKDAYYLYQSVWTDKPVLHIFPHWNWKKGETVDVWAYYNQADEVELFLNGKSMGVRKKSGDELHVMWRLKYEPGTLKAISRRAGKVVLVKEIETAGSPERIILQADKKLLKADGTDLSFITVSIVDKEGNLVPDADQLIKFRLSGQASIAGVDNGNEVSHEPFKANERKAFNGLCLVVVQSGRTRGSIVLSASGEGLEPAKMHLAAE